MLLVDASLSTGIKEPAVRSLISSGSGLVDVAVLFVAVHFIHAAGVSTVGRCMADAG